MLPAAGDGNVATRSSSRRRRKPVRKAGEIDPPRERGGRDLQLHPGWRRQWIFAGPSRCLCFSLPV